MVRPVHLVRYARSRARVIGIVIALAVPIGAAGPWPAQDEIRGRVVDEGTEQPVAGGAVLLLDAAGRRVHGVLTDAAGNFVLRVPGPGTYRLRAEMIGRRSVEREIVIAGAASFQTLALPVQPIELAGLEVDAAKRCSVRAEAAPATHVVWQEAQKALRAESITREEALYRFHIVRYERLIERRSENIRDEKVEYGASVSYDPFVTLPPDVLARDGYVHDEDGVSYVYGPNTDVLLSDGFQATHCFALRRDAQRPGQIGLIFEPVRGRRVADIEGVLWLDEASAELRDLEFRYRNIPRRLARGEYTGFATFQRLPSGAWVIHSWALRSPGDGGVHEVAGEVLELAPRDTTGAGMR
jgi:hypothetical protein